MLNETLEADREYRKSLASAYKCGRNIKANDKSRILDQLEKAIAHLQEDGDK